MKIDFYCIGAGPVELERPVGEIMGLFHISRIGNAEQGEAVRSALPAHTICIFNTVQDQPAGVKTEVWFHSEEGKLKRQIYESFLADTSEEIANAIKRLVMINIWNAIRELTGTEPSPWGILRGVRPTKIVHRLLDLGVAKQNIPELLKKKYLTTVDNAVLLTDIAAYQRRWLMKEAGKDRRISVYIGIPYCPSRCLYCSFPAYVLPKDRRIFNEFFQALKEDIRAAAATVKNLGLTVQTVYIGGGTPTSLGGEDLEELLSLATTGLLSVDTCEFTVEAGRPDSLDDRKISIMNRYAVTRVSVNPQSMQEKTLKLIGRNHTVEDIINIFGKIRNSGIPIINMDIIAGLPGENTHDFQDTMEKILELDPENITVHTLALKKGSTLKANLESINLPGEETTRNMLEVSRNLLTDAGFVPYYLYRQKYMTGNMENIGYTKPGLECIYNIQIMEERQTIIGIGPNAGTKAVNSPQTLESTYFPKNIDAYINSLHKYIDLRNRLLHELYGRV